MPHARHTRIQDLSTVGLIHNSSFQLLLGPRRVVLPKPTLCP
jgi:hypothetical protein